MRFSFKSYLNLFLFFTGLLFLSCVDIPDDVVLPQWDTEVNIPLMQKSYTLKQIIKTQAHILIDSTGDNNIFLLQSGKYFLNSGLSEFVQVDESSALENVPTITSQADSFIVYVLFPEGLEVDSGEFASGLLNLTVNNASQENVSVILRLPAFHNSQGNDLIIQTDVPAGETNSVDLNIDGYNYERPFDQPSDLRNSFKVVARAFSQHQGNVVYTSMSVSNLSFNYVTGLIPSKSLGNKTSSYYFDVADVDEYRDRSLLKEAKLYLIGDYLSMFNTPNMLEIKNLNIVAKRNDGSELYLKDKTNNPNFTIRMNNGSMNTVFTEANSNITDFITFFPDSVILRAEYIVNPDNNSGTFSNLDSIKFETYFSTKSYLALQSTTLEDQVQIIISENDRKDIRNGKQADLNLEFENGIPLVAWVKIDMLDENNNYLFTLVENNTAGDSIPFDPASVNSAGEVIASNFSPCKIHNT